MPAAQFCRRCHPPQREHPDSILAANIAACCAFRTGGPAAALQCLGGLPAQLPPGGGSPGGALVLHNAVVFGDGAGGMQVCLNTSPHAACSEPSLFPQQTAHCTPSRKAQCLLQVLPPLVGVVPEARLNLALLHCRRGEPARALDLLRSLEPATALEHICKVGGWQRQLDAPSMTQVSSALTARCSAYGGRRACHLNSLN